MSKRRAVRAVLLSLSLTAPVAPFVAPLAAQPVRAAAASRLTSPKSFLGFAIGDDWKLATYTQLTDYWKKLDTESDRMRLVDIGKTAEGRSQLMAIVTAPENFAKLERYREIAERLARAEGITEAQARALAQEGKAIVWIDGGLHANEVLGAHQLIETVWQLVSRDDAETRRLLRDVIVLAVHANPDGMELVSSWYMQEKDTLRRNMNIPRLYQKYIGHDDNRDFYAATQPETQNMMKVQYREWYPQIVYNHHQTGPAGTVMFAPPFRDPFNYNFDPLVPIGVDMVGAAMHTRFLAEGKPGVTMRSGAPYSTWWNGGLRTAVYFHNMIGLLTETIGNPTPMRIPLVPDNVLPRGDLPAPIAPQEWHFRQSIDYSITANYAVLDLASRYREQFLFNIWRMGRNAIDRGSRDSWTVTPKRVDSLRLAAAAADSTRAAESGARGPVSAGRSPAVNARFFETVLRDPAKRDPRAYVIPSDQADFGTAVKFVNTLRHAGIDVQRATAPLRAAGKTYPAGSLVVSTAQAFRAYVLDMFEPQDHPHDFAYPGGPPRRPYDVAGWTLAYQMGVQFDRLFEPVTGALEPVKGFATAPATAVASAAGAKGFVLSASQNDAVIAVNRLLKAGADVRRAGDAFWVANGAGVPAVLERAGRELGVRATGAAAAPSTTGASLHTPRVALWDQYGGSMPSGWTRWLLERFEFPFDVVFPKTLDAGNLRAKYDVLVLPAGAVPASDRPTGFGGGGGGDAAPGGGGRFTPPASFDAMTGRVSVATTVPKIREFLEQGGTVITIGPSTTLAYHLGLPVKSALVTKDASGAERPLSADQFYIPGSVLEVAVDTTLGISAGMGPRADVMFDNSPAFKLQGEPSANVKPIAWYASKEPLRSGWAWGQERLDGAAAAVQASVGKGTLYLFGPEILFRAQPHGTFKWFFNALLDSGASQTVVP